MKPNVTIGAMSNKLGLEGFKGEKIVTYLGLFISISTLFLLYRQYFDNKEHMAIQKQLAQKQLDKLNAEG